VRSPLFCGQSNQCHSASPHPGQVATNAESCSPDCD
jgi:hypothetical protein